MDRPGVSRHIERLLLADYCLSRGAENGQKQSFTAQKKSETQAGMGYLADLETDLYSWRKNCGFT